MTAEMATPDADPVTALAAWLNAMDVTSRDTAAKLKRNERNRLGLLLVHGIAALAIAPAFAYQLGGSDGMANPSFALLRQIPGAPYSLAFTLGIGGAVLIPATIVRHRGWELAGLVCLATWYTTMTVTLGGAFIPWAIAGQVAATRPSTFAPILYAHLGTIMLVHIRTLWKLRHGRDDT